MNYSVSANFLVSGITLFVLAYAVHRLTKANKVGEPGTHLSALLWVMGVMWCALAIATFVAVWKGYA